MLAHRLRYYLLRSEEILRRIPKKIRPHAEHARAAIEWIMRAMKVTPDGGIAQLYDALSACWRSSYPEVTGYVIPTLIHAARLKLYDPVALRQAAWKLARWLLAVQREDGSFPAGTIDGEDRGPSVFNTGQILWGLTAMINEFSELAGDLDRAARRAADWMISQQDQDGAWRRGVSPYTKGPFHAYYVYAARALALYGREGRHPEAIASAKRNADFVLSLATPCGWIREMGFSSDKPPLLHTVAYTLQGLLDIGRWIATPAYVNAAETAARRILSLQNPQTGALPGRIAENFIPDVRWSSTPANAQMAVLWFDLAELTDDKRWSQAAELALRFNCSLQEMDHPNPDRRGALRGNFPSLPGYGCGQYFSWTQKFFLDALMICMARESV